MLSEYYRLSEQYDDNYYNDTPAVLSNLPRIIKENTKIEELVVVTNIVDKFNISISLLDTNSCYRLVNNIVRLINRNIYNINNNINLLLELLNVSFRGIYNVSFSIGIRCHFTTLAIKILKLVKPSDVYIHNSDFMIDWRLLWDLNILLLDDTYENILLTKKTERSYDKFKNLIATLICHSRNYFHHSCRDEIFKLSASYLNPLSLHYLKYVGLIQLFFPSLTNGVDNKNIDFNVYIEKLLKLCYGVDRLDHLTIIVINLLARIASCNIGIIDWTPHLPVIFHLFSHCVNLDGSKSEFPERSYPSNLIIDCSDTLTRCNASASSSPATAISMIIASNWHLPETSKFLSHYLSLHNIHISSSNLGRSNISLSELVCVVCKFLSMRISFQRRNDYNSSSCLNLIESPFNITELCAPILLNSMLYSKSAIVVNCATSGLQSLISIDGEHILPLIWIRCLDDLDSLEQPNKVNSALVLISKNISKMVSIIKIPNLGTYLQKIFTQLTSLIEPSDPVRMTTALTALVVFFYTIPFYSAGSDTAEGLELSDSNNVSIDSQDQARSFTLQMPELIGALLIKIDNLLLHANSLSILNATDATVIQTIIRFLHAMVFSVDSSILKFIRKEIYSKALRNCMVEKNETVTLLYGSFLQGIFWADQSNGTSEIIEPLIDLILERIGSKNISAALESSETEQLLKLLIFTIKYSGKDLLRCKSKVEDLVFRLAIVQSKSENGNKEEPDYALRKCCGKLVNTIFTSMLSIYPLERSPLNPDVVKVLSKSSDSFSSNEIMIRRHWFKWGSYGVDEDIENINVTFHETSVEELDFVRNLFLNVNKTFVQDIISTISTYDGENTDNLSKSSLGTNHKLIQSNLGILKRSIKGLQPVLGNWQGESVSSSFLNSQSNYATEIDELGQIFSREDKLLGIIQNSKINEEFDENDTISEDEDNEDTTSDDNHIENGFEFNQKNGTLKIKPVPFAPIYPQLYMQCDASNPLICKFESLNYSSNEPSNSISLRTFFGELLNRVFRIILNYQNKLVNMSLAIHPSTILQLVSISNKLLCFAWIYNPLKSIDDMTMKSRLYFQYDHVLNRNIICRSWFVERLVVLIDSKLTANNFKLKFSKSCSELIFNLVNISLTQVPEVKGVSIHVVATSLTYYPKAFNRFLLNLNEVLTSNSESSILSTLNERKLAALALFMHPSVVPKVFQSYLKLDSVLQCLLLIMDSPQNDEAVSSLVHAWFMQILNYLNRTHIRSPMMDADFEIKLDHSNINIPKEFFLIRSNYIISDRNQSVSIIHQLVRKFLNRVWLQERNGSFQSSIHWRFQLIGCSVISSLLNTLTPKYLSSLESVITYLLRAIIQVDVFPLRQISLTSFATLLHSFQNCNISNVELKNQDFQNLKNQMLFSSDSNESFYSDNEWNSTKFMDNFLTGWSGQEGIVKMKSFISFLSPDIVTFLKNSFANKKYLASIVSLMQQRHKSIADEALEANSVPNSSSSNLPNISQLFQGLQNSRFGEGAKKGISKILAKLVSPSSAILLLGAYLMGSGEQIENFVKSQLDSDKIKQFHIYQDLHHSRQTSDNYFNPFHSYLIKLIVTHTGVDTFKNLYDQLILSLDIFDSQKNIHRVDSQQLLCTISEILAGLLKVVIYLPPADQNLYSKPLFDVVWTCIDKSGLDTIIYFRDALKWVVSNTDPRRLKHFFLIPLLKKFGNIVELLVKENFSHEITSSLTVDLQKLLICISSVIHELNWKSSLDNDSTKFSFVAAIAKYCKPLLNFPSEGVRNTIGTLLVSLKMCLSHQSYGVNLNTDINFILQEVVNFEEKTDSSNKDQIRAFFNFVNSLQLTDRFLFNGLLNSILTTLFRTYPDSESELVGINQTLLGYLSFIRLETNAEVSQVIEIVTSKVFSSTSWKVRRLGVWFMDTFLPRHSYLLSQINCELLSKYFFELLLRDSSTDLSFFACKVISRRILTTIINNPSQNNRGELFVNMPYVLTESALSKKIGYNSDIPFSNFSLFPTIINEIEASSKMDIDDINNSQNIYNVNFSQKNKEIILNNQARRYSSLEPLLILIKKWKAEANYKSDKIPASDLIRIQLGGILGLCSVILSNPFDVPIYLPRVIEILVGLGNTTKQISSISSVLKKVFQEFKSSHNERWDDFKTRFTQNQLDLLRDLDDAPSYIV